jgi:ABC-type multidrug transport system fused ATPase/permease subunit
VCQRINIRTTYEKTNKPRKIVEIKRTPNKSFNKINNRHQQLLTRTFRKKELSSPLNETLGAFVLVSIVWFGGSMILDDVTGTNLSGAEFITFIVMFSQLLRPIQGVAPDMSKVSVGCALQRRCEYAQSKCATENPLFSTISTDRYAACWYPQDHALQNESLSK